MMKKVLVCHTFPTSLSLIIHPIRTSNYKAVGDGYQDLLYHTLAYLDSEFDPHDF